VLRGSSRARAPHPAALLTMRRRSKHLGAPGVDTATLLCVLRGMLCLGNVAHRLASVCDGGDNSLRLAEAPRIMARRALAVSSLYLVIFSGVKSPRTLVQWLMVAKGS